MKYLKVWTSFREAMAPLSDAEKGRLFDAMLQYAESGEEPAEFRGNERFLWPSAKVEIDLMAQKSEKYRENGKKGGRPVNQEKANESYEKQNKAKESEINQTEPNETIKKRNINKENEKETLLTEGKEKATRFSPPTKEEILDFCLEESLGIDIDKFYDYYKSVGWKVGGKAPMKDWKATVRNWARRDKEKKETPQRKTVFAQQYQQRDYSSEQDDALQRMLQMGVN